MRAVVAEKRPDRSRLSRPLLLAVVTALAAAAPLAAGAQGAPATGGQASRGEGLGEIVVTARKREETLQSVPLSITALTDEFIERARVESIMDVAQFTPGLVYQNINGTLALPVIRGLAQSNIAGDNNVGMFLNGIYIANNRTLDLGLVDLARIEVIKGPQSALYGQNSFSGAINYVTKRPEVFDANVSASVGTDEFYEARAAVGGPIGEMFAARIGVTWNQFDGTFRNQAGGNLQGYENRGVTGEIAFLPTEAFTARLFGYWSDQQYDQPAQYLVANNCGRSAQNTPTYFCGTVPIRSTFDLSRGIAYGRQAENGIGSLDLEFRFGGAWTLKSLTAYVRSESDSYLDFDFTSTGVPFVARNTVTNATRTVLANTYLGQGLGEFKDRSQELRLTFDGERLSGAIGAYYYDSDRRDGSDAAVDTSMLGANEVFSGLGLLFGTPNPSQPRISNRSQTEVETRALFAQLGFSPLPGVRLSGEFRRARDERSIFRIINFGAPVTVNARQSAVFTNNTPRVTVDWQATQDVLFYSSWARGVRSGGFNANATLPQEAAYAPEENETYELGAKTTWLDGRMLANVSVYYVDWTNMQLPSRSIDPANIFSMIRNTGNAISSGVELQLDMAPTENLRFGLGYSHVNPRFKQGAQDLGLAAFCGVDASICPTGTVVGGQQLARTIRNQYSGYAELGFPVGVDWRAYVRADAAYLDRQPTSALNVQFIPSYAIVNARIGLEAGRYELALWAKNLLDEDYITATSAQPRFHTGTIADVTFGYGRIVGLTASARFGR